MTVEALEIDGPALVRYAEKGTGPVGYLQPGRATTETVDDWVLSGADADEFTINDANGELTFNSPPDFENPEGCRRGKYLPSDHHGLCRD